MTTNRGRIDAVIELDKIIYLFEFKLDGSAQAALNQVKKTKYYERYQGKGKLLQMVGVNFDGQQRSISEWKLATA